MIVDGRAVVVDAPRAAMAAGIALIPEDRRGQSLVPIMSVEQNFALANPGAFARRGVIRGALRRQAIMRYIEELDIRPPRPDAIVRDLSGGNQQKVVIARWLAHGRASLHLRRADARNRRRRQERRSTTSSVGSPRTAPPSSSSPPNCPNCSRSPTGSALCARGGSFMTSPIPRD